MYTIIILFVLLVIWAQIARILINYRFKNPIRFGYDSYGMKWINFHGRIIGSRDLKHIGLWITPRLAISFSWDRFSPWMLSYPIRLPRQWFAGLIGRARGGNGTVLEKWLVLPRNHYQLCPWIIRFMGLDISRYRPGCGFAREHKPAGIFFSETKFNRKSIV